MRRTRIKGVANIPQRKKTDLPSKGDDNAKIQQIVPDSEGSNNIEPQNHARDLEQNLATGKQIISEEIIKIPEKLAASPNLKSIIEISEVSEINKLETSKVQSEHDISITNKLVIENLPKPIRINSNIAGIKNEIIQNSSGSRAIHNLFENNQDDIHNEKTEQNEDKSSIDLTITEKSGMLGMNDVHEAKDQKYLDLSQRDFLQPSKSPLNTHMNSGKNMAGPSDIKKIISPHPSIGSDTEYPIPPVSPNKMNRTRIKAIPRIGHRKISFSASESEDESKKVTHRITPRKDSQSSTIPLVQETIIETPSTPKVKEFSSVIQRKCKRTEWSRKLAEARREFTRKFETGKPDHKKLTMIDLIFYNPSTKPMGKEEKRTQSESNSNSKDEDPINLSENEDDPGAKEKEAEKSKSSDEENEMPAPQIKIGPAGEIILDEKSLVIENKQTKKNREEMQRSRVIDGNSDRPYGVVKRVKRSKDWSHSETLRFYKALSTIGTDFSLMCELFPNRTRRELKMKFKKEERVNQALVDKAVMEPCGFDFAELKKEFELAEIELKELENQKIKDEKLRKNKEIKKSIKFLNITQENTVNTSVGRTELKPENVKTESDSETKNFNETSIKIKKKRDSTKLRKRKLDIMSVLSDSDSIDTDSEESEIIWRPTQTRYGRKVRKRQIYDPVPSLDEELIIPRKILKPIEEKEPEQKPGSIMMVHSETTDGEPIVKIFMVTDKDGDGTLNTDNLLPIAMIKAGETAKEQEEIVENNYTIPAEPQGNDVES